jgi:hypothetical protein
MAYQNLKDLHALAMGEPGSRKVAIVTYNAAGGVEGVTAENLEGTLDPEGMQILNAIENRHGAMEALAIRATIAVVLEALGLKTLVIDTALAATIWDRVHLTAKLHEHNVGLAEYTLTSRADGEPQ